MIQYRLFSIDKAESSVTNDSLIHRLFRTSDNSIKSNCKPSLPNLTLSLLLLVLSVLHCELRGDTNLLEDNESSQLVGCSTSLRDERCGLIPPQAEEKMSLCFKSKSMKQLYYPKERCKGSQVQERVQAVNP